MSHSHDTATIDPGAEIGSGTYIWHNSHVRESARIGDHCVIGEHVYIGPNVVIGSGVKVQNNVSIYEAVTIEDDVFVGPSVVFTNVINPRAFIERKDEFRPTLVQKGATLGANCTLLCGISIGGYALVGSGTVVTRDVPAYALVVGNPARQIGWVSKAGHRLPIRFGEHGEASCHTSGEIYMVQENSCRPKL